ncbi:alkaline phosphatase [Flavobacterium sp.]|uniref:alkaline phosphatase n=1 Tax=Flavobacterium sp. TaxID=239 RepID=UPI003C542044
MLIYHKRYCVFFLCISFSIFAQHYSTSNIHSHNDYANSQPFVEAYTNEVGVIEADVFFDTNELFVAHKLNEITTDKTLRELYLNPLLENLKKQGQLYPNNKPLVLMIDVKTEALATLNEIVKQLRAYPDLISNSQFSVIISGNRPNPETWINYPSFISFDGRLNENYSDHALAKVEMISEDLKNLTVWNGKGVLTHPDLIKIQSVIEKVHHQNKKIRFWSTQDNVNTWITLMNLGVDYLGTDKTTDLTHFINTKKQYSYQNTDFHKAYIPKGQVQFSSSKKPKNVILLIGDGMGLTQIYAGYTANKGELSLFNMPVQGFSITKASDSYITDSAAGATAMATGQKSNNRYIGVDALGKPLESITQKLAKNNFQTAIISSGNATDATPASFYAHQIDRSYNEAIALDFLSNSSDVLIGGGVEEFTKRNDGQNLVEKLLKKGYTFSSHFNSLDTIQNSRFVILDNAAVVSKKDGRGDFLVKAFSKTIQNFSKSKRPFFIMEEGAQIDYGGHKNEMDYVVRELLDFDQLVGVAMEFVDKNKETLLVITADHETGGLSIIDGDIEKGYVHGNFSTNDHTAVNVPVFAYGPGAENFKGVYQNTAIYSKLIPLLKKK